MSNPLMSESFNTPFEATPFDLIKPSHFVPAIEFQIAAAKEKINSLKTVSKPSFKTIIEPLESAEHRVGLIAGIFFNLHSSESSDELQAVAKDFSPLLTAFSNDINLDEELFAQVKKVYDQRASEDLNTEQARLLEKTYKGFVRNGALLKGEQKEKLRAVDQELSQLSLKFGDNVLAETNQYKLFVTDKSELNGLPESALEAAAQSAKEEGKEGQWLFNLTYPSYIPFMTYAGNRKLRETLYRASTSRGAKENEYNNREIIKKIAELRFERANLLGFKTHADYVLEERMAEKPESVHSFLENLLTHALPAGKKESQELEAFAKQTEGVEKLMPWDTAYFSEKLKQKTFSFDEELLKPYFRLESTIDGIFMVAKKLYGLEFKERKDIPVYHKDVKTYEVQNEKGEYVSLFYADFFPRPGKRSGAWMTSFRSQSIQNGKDQRPHISIVCNFTKPTETKPSLLTFNEVLTFFHEFGHALHGMLANSQYETLSGTNVYWDFVELPSQIMENWAYEKECLDLFAKHYETGEKIPAEYIQKIKDASNFHEGRGTLRQISLGLIDMTWHSTDPKTLPDVFELEKEIHRKTNLFEPVEGSSTSCSFSHIFQGGYSAGYYSYKWAEVLDADAFEYFKEKGLFNQEVAKSFKENILSRGGSEHPMTLYKRFRGAEPKPEALLRRSGLIQA